MNWTIAFILNYHRERLDWLALVNRFDSIFCIDLCAGQVLMISSIAGLPNSVRANSIAAPSKATGAFSQTLLAVKGSQSAVTISSAAQAKGSPGSVPVGFDFNYNNIDHTQEEFKAYYAEGARQISESQGLPEGHFDFTRLSAKQVRIIQNDAVMNHGATFEDVFGLDVYVSNGTNNKTSDRNAMLSETVGDAVALIEQQRSYYAGLGNTDNVAMFQQTLNWMLNSRFDK